MTSNEPAARPATICDVAKAAGVSAFTVSRTIARPGRVCHWTARRVREVAAELGCRFVELHVPRPDGPGMHRTLALVVADISNPVFSEVMRGVEEDASGSGCTTVLSHARESPVVERQVLGRLVAEHRLTEERAADIIVELVDHAPRKAFRL